MCVLDRLSPLFYLDILLIVALVLGITFGQRNKLGRVIAVILIVLLSLVAMVLIYASYYNCNAS
jgi:uncharacterized membrane protein